MSEKSAAPSLEGNAIQISHFPIGKGLYLRYGFCCTDKKHNQGTVIVLPDWDSPLAANDTLVAALHSRGFHMVTYDWHQHGQAERDDNGSGPCDFRFNTGNLDIFFQTVVLPDFPGPFYVLAMRMGGLFALKAHDILHDQIQRMAILSPILETHGHRANSFYHHYMRIRSLMRPSHGKNSKNSGADSISTRRVPQWYRMALDAAADVLSPGYSDHMKLPTLFIISTCDTMSNPRLTKEFSKKLRLAESVTIHGAHHDILHDRHCYRKQFWQAFDAFIPGSGTPVFNHLLEDNAII